jgi:hypothetical protein
MENPTPYKDINAIEALFTKELKKIFDTQIVGFYLTGILSIPVLIVSLQSLLGDNLRSLRK